MHNASIEKESINALPEMQKLMQKYRLPKKTTFEDLESQIKTFFNKSVIVNFGEHILIAGFFPTKGKEPYYVATYEYDSTDKHAIDDPIHLASISTTKFSDSGNALLWQMRKLGEDERQPIKQSEYIGSHLMGKCPKCEKILNVEDHRSYCGYCGQPVKW